MRRFDLKSNPFMRPLACIATIVFCLSYAQAAPPQQPQPAQQSGADELVKKGEELFKAGKYREAIAAYKQVLDRDPNNDQAIAYTSYSFNKLGDRAQARQWMKKRVDIPGQNPSVKGVVLNDIALLCWDDAHLAVQSKLFSGDGYLKAEDGAAAQALLSEGIDSAQKALSIAPRSIKALNLLNLLYRASAEIEPDPAKQKDLIAKADEALRQAIKFYESLAAAPNDLFAIPTMLVSSRISAAEGVALGQPVKAAPLLSADPNDKTIAAIEVFVGTDGKVRLQRLVGGQSRTGNAALGAARQWEFQPSTFEGHTVQVAQVLTFGGQGNSLNTSSAQAATGREELEGKVVDHIERGDQLARNKQYEEALAEYKAAIEAAGKPVFTVYQNMGGVYFQKENYRAAAESYRQAILARPQDRAGYYNLGEALYASGDYHEAEMAYRKAIELTPGRVDSRSHHFLGLSLYNQKRVEEAIAEYRLSIDQSRGKYAEARYNLGIALLESGKYQAAETEFRTAIEQEAKDWPDAHFNLATTIERMKRYKEAADEYEIYLRQAPNAQNAESLKKRIAQLRSQK